VEQLRPESRFFKAAAKRWANGGQFCTKRKTVYQPFWPKSRFIWTFCGRGGVIRTFDLLLPRTEGLYRRQVPAYDEKVVRELVVNALVHRPYTQQGDIYVNLFPDRLEVVNPGRLPIGVTPHNILHASRRRNEGLARVFHDLNLMEREGSGFDLMYDRLLSQDVQHPLPKKVQIG
jgi:hypothetical protein